MKEPAFDDHDIPLLLDKPDFASVMLNTAWILLVLREAPI
jgi:hypothetical protein